MAHHRNPRSDDRPRPLDRGSPSLQLHDLAAGLLDESLSALDGDLVARLIAPHRHVADHQRRSQPTANRLAEHHHLVHRDGLGARVAEDYHRRGIAHQDDVDAGLLGGPRRGIVIGGDHHDRLARFPSSRQGGAASPACARLAPGQPVARTPVLMRGAPPGGCRRRRLGWRRRRGRRLASRSPGRSRRRRRRRRR